MRNSAWVNRSLRGEQDKPPAAAAAPHPPCPTLLSLKPHVPLARPATLLPCVLLQRASLMDVSDLHLRLWKSWLSWPHLSSLPGWSQRRNRRSFSQLDSKTVWRNPVPQCQTFVQQSNLQDGLRARPGCSVWIYFFLRSVRAFRSSSKVFIFDILRTKWHIIIIEPLPQ